MIINEGSSLTIFNDRLSLTIVSETTNFIKKTVVFGKITCNFIAVLHEVKKLWGSLNF